MRIKESGHTKEDAAGAGTRDTPLCVPHNAGTLQRQNTCMESEVDQLDFMQLGAEKHFTVTVKRFS